MSSWHRKYFVLKPQASGDAIGVVSVLCSDAEAGIFYFSLHRPDQMHNGDAEFLDLNYTEIPFSEYETHKDVFETIEEVEIVKEWTTTSSMGISVLVRKAKGEVNTDT